MSVFSRIGEGLVRVATGFGLLEWIGNRILGRRINAVLKLTVKAAFRYRLIWVLLGLLLGSVVALPLLIKDDGTARGFIQIMLTYNLSIITALLGLATLWLSCGTMARDIEEAQLQVVVTKPIARWQVWIGKWLGILVLDAMLLAVSGFCVYSLLEFRASKLPPDEYKILRDEIFVARGSLTEPVPDIEPDVERVFQERLKQTQLSALDQQLLRKQIAEQLKASLQIVGPNYVRRWTIDLGLRKNSLRDQPLFVRMKFIAAQTNLMDTYSGTLHVGPPESLGYVEDMRLSGNTYHEIPIPPNLFDAAGKLTIDFVNRDETVMLFPLEDSMEVLYREGGFGLNFARGLAIIFCWLALLAALGLAAASLLSFPVAAFFSLTILLLGLSTGTLSQVIEQGTIFSINHETGKADNPTFVDAIMVEIFKGALKVINVVEGFSPVSSLSSGRSITWTQLGKAGGQIILLMGGSFALVGIILLNRRELATAQGNV